MCTEIYLIHTCLHTTYHNLVHCPRATVLYERFTRMDQALTVPDEYLSWPAEESFTLPDIEEVMALSDEPFDSPTHAATAASVNRRQAHVKSAVLKKISASSLGQDALHEFTCVTAYLNAEAWQRSMSFKFAAPVMKREMVRVGSLCDTCFSNAESNGVDMSKHHDENEGNDAQYDFELTGGVGSTETQSDFGSLGETEVLELQHDFQPEGNIGIWEEPYDFGPTESDEIVEESYEFDLAQGGRIVQEDYDDLPAAERVMVEEPGNFEPTGEDRVPEEPQTFEPGGYDMVLEEPYDLESPGEDRVLEESQSFEPGGCGMVLEEPYYSEPPVEDRVPEEPQRFEPRGYDMVLEEPYDLESPGEDRVLEESQSLEPGGCGMVLEEPYNFEPTGENRVLEEPQSFEPRGCGMVLEEPYRFIPKRFITGEENSPLEDQYHFESNDSGFHGLIDRTEDDQIIENQNFELENSGDSGITNPTAASLNVGGDISSIQFADDLSDQQTCTWNEDNLPECMPNMQEVEVESHLSQDQEHIAEQETDPGTLAIDPFPAELSSEVMDPSRDQPVHSWDHSIVSDENHSCRELSPSSSTGLVQSTDVFDGILALTSRDVLPEPQLSPRQPRFKDPRLRAEINSYRFSAAVDHAQEPDFSENFSRPLPHVYAPTNNPHTYTVEHAPSEGIAWPSVPISIKDIVEHGPLTAKSIALTIHEDRTARLRMAIVKSFSEGREETETEGAVDEDLWEEESIIYDNAIDFGMSDEHYPCQT